MRGNEVEVDSFVWNKVERTEKWFEAKYIKISERGEMIISAGLKKALAKEGKMEPVSIESADELRLLKVFPVANGGFQFPKNGRIKFLEFSQKLEQQGYSLPAVYQVEWNENAGVWVGVLEEIEKAPKIIRKRKSSGKKII